MSAPRANDPSAGTPKTVGIVVFPDAEELDFVGPWEVFSMAAKLRGGDVAGGHGDPLGVVSIAETREAVRCAKGLRVVPDHTFQDAPELDILLVPGGFGTRQQASSPAMLEFLRGVAPRCEWLTSVCTGSYVLHGAGFTAGKRITTHWAFVEQLRKEASDATVLDDVRYVRDGNLVTAAGVSAGIDMSLWLVGEIWGAATARTVQSMMQYDPAPPYSAET